VEAVMMSLFRSGGRASVHLPTLRRALRHAVRGTDARRLRGLTCFAALAALLFCVIPAQADEIEPEVEPAGEAEPAPAVAPKPEVEPAQEPVTKAEVAPEAEGIPEPSWIPSIETGFETFDYNTKTTVENRINPPAGEGTQHEASRQLMYRIGGELMGPAFEDLPGKPRFFVKGGVQIKTFSSDKMFALGDPTIAGEPQSSVNSYYLQGNFKGENLPTDFVGQGSEVFGTFQDPSWYAALGVAFSVPIASNLLLQIKPSLQYSMEEIDLTGAFSIVDEPNPLPDGVMDPDPCGTAPKNPQPPPCLRVFDVYQSRGDASTTDHSVGAGLELALALFRNARPVRVSLYTEARFMWLVSGSTTTFGDPAVPASFSVERDNFGIRGGGGVRLSWVGFD
jgi:hypothetical protein